MAARFQSSCPMASDAPLQVICQQPLPRDTRLQRGTLPEPSFEGDLSSSCLLHPSPFACLSCRTMVSSWCCWAPPPPGVSKGTTWQVGQFNGQLREFGPRKSGCSCSLTGCLRFCWQRSQRHACAGCSSPSPCARCAVPRLQAATAWSTRCMTWRRSCRRGCAPLLREMRACCWRHWACGPPRVPVPQKWWLPCATPCSTRTRVGAPARLDSWAAQDFIVHVHASF